MDDSIQELLQAESEAEAIVSKGEQQRNAIVQKSLDDAYDMEQQFQQRLPEMHQSFIDKAHERAVHTIAEMKLRYDERNQELRELAGQHDAEALQQAIELILNSDSSGP